MSTNRGSPCAAFAPWPEPVPALAIVVIRVLIATLQAVGVVYAALVAWIASSWMVNDSWAMRATEMDWWSLAAERVLWGITLALAVGAILLSINYVLVCLKIARNARPVRTALIGALIVASSSAAGAVHFAFQRPWF